MRQKKKIKMKFRVADGAFCPLSTEQGHGVWSCQLIPATEFQTIECS